MSDQVFTCPTTSDGTGQTSISFSPPGANTLTQIAVVVCCFT
jgi:hypothetical protein